MRRARGPSRCTESTVHVAFGLYTIYCPLGVKGQIGRTSPGGTILSPSPLVRVDIRSCTVYTVVHMHVYIAMHGHKICFQKGVCRRPMRVLALVLVCIIGSAMVRQLKTHPTIPIGLLSMVEFSSLTPTEQVERVREMGLVLREVKCPDCGNKKPMPDPCTAPTTRDPNIVLYTCPYCDNYKDKRITEDASMATLLIRDKKARVPSIRRAARSSLPIYHLKILYIRSHTHACTHSVTHIMHTWTSADMHS
jgi:hypothetical protein